MLSVPLQHHGIPALGLNNSASKRKRNTQTKLQRNRVKFDDYNTLILFETVPVNILKTSQYGTNKPEDWSISIDFARTDTDHVALLPAIDQARAIDAPSHRSREKSLATEQTACIPMAALRD